MQHRPLVLVCLVALVLSLTPASVGHAAVPAAARPPVVFVSGQQLLTDAAPPAQGDPLQALRVGFTESKLFTVVCREWAANGDIDTTQGSWYLGETPSPAAVAGSIPIVGHACAFAEDPSLENGVILALDIPVVILYARVVLDGVVAVNGIAMTVSALAPVALATGPAGVASAIQIVRTQVDGYLAVIRQDLATARREGARTAQLQAYIKENHDWTVALNEEWVSGALPKVVQAALADPTVRHSVGSAIESAGDAVGAAAGQGAAAIESAGDAVGTAAGQGAAAIGQSGASAGVAVGAGAQAARGAVTAAVVRAGELLREGCARLPDTLPLTCAAAAR